MDKCDGANTVSLAGSLGQAGNRFGLNHGRFVGTAVDSLLICILFQIDHTLAVFADFTLNTDEVMAGGRPDQGGDFVAHGRMRGLAGDVVRPRTGITGGVPADRFNQRHDRQVGIIRIDGPRQLSGGKFEIITYGWFVESTGRPAVANGQALSGADDA